MAVHVKTVSVLTLLDGLISTRLTTGSVFSMVTLSDRLPVPPDESVAVAVQVMTSSGANDVLLS